MDEVVLERAVSIAGSRIAYVVDDDDAVRESTVALLESEHIATLGFATAESFLANFDAARAGCLIFDIHMPEVSGLDLLSQLRGRGVTTPAVLFTGSGDTLMMDTAKGSGALTMLHKPPDDKELLALVKAAFAR